MSPLRVRFGAHAARLRPAMLITALLATTALALLPAAAAAGPRHRGIDVSRFQGPIDWPAVAKTKTSFVWAAASRGRGNDCNVVPTECGTDPTYQQNYRGATEAGIRVGAYHRAFPQGATRRKARRDAKAEARRFIRSVRPIRRGDLLPVLDFEAPLRRLDERRARLWIRTWIDRVQSATGAKPMIYTNNSSWQATGNTRRFARAGHQLWVANYNVPSPLVPASNWGGRGWKAWQFTSSGKVKGINGNVDKNKLEGGFKGITVSKAPLERRKHKRRR